MKREAEKPLSHLPGHGIGFVPSGTRAIPMTQLGLQKQKAGELVVVASLDVPERRRSGSMQDISRQMYGQGDAVVQSLALSFLSPSPQGFFSALFSVDVLIILLPC